MLFNDKKMKGVKILHEVKKRLLHIHYCRGTSWKMIFQFFRFDPTLQSIFHMSQNDFVEKFHLKKQTATIFYEDLHSLKIDEIVIDLKKNNIVPITYFDEDYPMLLKEIYDPPWILYCKGNRSLLHKQKLLAVIGTRTPTSYSIHCLNYLLPPLIKENVTIVSGLALGVDTLAHKITMKEKGTTIGVLGSGFYHMYPIKNKKLASDMSVHQLLITEYPPHIRPQKWHFPARNRIISGISKGVLIIEAKERSGSLITADFALEQGRDVFSIPGSIFSEHSKGTNNLIRQGAKLVMKAEDIFEEWN